MRVIAAASAMFLATSIVALSNTFPPFGFGLFDGQRIFRFDTFGDEQLWTDTLRMHEAVQNLTPATALGVGLKVDSEALPPSVIRVIKSGQLDVNDPAVTRQLLKLNAVVGIVARVRDDEVKRLGITCAFCHSTVDNSIATGIGRRLDGWPNLTLDVGQIVSLSPALDPALKEEFMKWGPGKYDPRHHIFDGNNIIPLNTPSIPVVIPPAYGLQGVRFETFNGDGPISYWNSYVGVTQMGGQGSFFDRRIGVRVFQFPDLVTPKLPALLAYQLSLKAPRPPARSFNRRAAARGEDVFNGVAGCSTCHIPPTYTDVRHGPNPAVPFLHSPAEVGTDPSYAERSATGLYRTTPLRALWQHAPYFHDGSAPDLVAVVDHYIKVFGLTLTAEQKSDLVEFLKSL
jgi:hypothetical protein